MPAAPETIAWFRAAASYLHRGDLRCPEHKVAHTGKLARAAVLDLALLDATGDVRHWRRAVERAQYVASRLAPDPEHSGLIYLPGRFDPRNCSNSVIDSGECTDALARVLLHPRAIELAEATREQLRRAVTGNAETYLRSAVVEKEITNQRLWGAMGLATAWQLEGRERWRDALRESLARSITEQRADGSWGYQPDAPRYGAHPGAADLTVYYHGRCLAFLLQVLERVPRVDLSGEGERALERGLRFLAAVTLPDGSKPLALEGKRWFWDGDYEAGSNAYDVFALMRGAERFGNPKWRDLALRAWRTLTRHQQPDGRIEATLTAPGRPAIHNFVCPDFHTADLAWTAQVMGELPEPRKDVVATSEFAPGPMAIQFPDAGVVRLELGSQVALARTRKLPANTQFGGAVGGGAIAALARCDRPVRVLPRTLEGAFVLTDRPSLPGAVAGVRRFLRENPPGREGRQWLFVARLLATRGRFTGAWKRLWRGYLGPLAGSWRDRVSSAWAPESSLEETGTGLVVSASATRRDGSVPAWASDLQTVRRLELTPDGLQVLDTLKGGMGGAAAIALEYVIPADARDVEVSAERTPVHRSGASVRRVSATLSAGTHAVSVSYRL